jgi:hypothetical protein
LGALAQGIIVSTLLAEHHVDVVGNGGSCGIHQGVRMLEQSAVHGPRYRDFS